MSCSSLHNAQCSLPILFSPLPVQAPVRMGRTPHASLAQIFREVDQGVDLLVAFRAHPGLTWGQVQRAWGWTGPSRHAPACFNEVRERNAQWAQCGAGARF